MDYKIHHITNQTPIQLNKIKPHSKIATSLTGTKSGNKGYDAALSAIEMVNLIHSIANHQDSNK